MNYYYFGFGIIYLVIAAGWLLLHPENRAGLVRMLKPSAWVEREERLVERS